MEDLFIKQYFDTDPTSSSIQEEDYNTLIDLLSIDSIMIDELSYSAKNYIKINQFHHDEYLKTIEKENPLTKDFIKSLPFRDISNNVRFLEKKPFIQLSNKKYIIDPLISINYLDRIIANLIYNGDTQKFTNIHAPNFEKQVFEFLYKLFPTAKFYPSYKYRDKINGKMESIEIDLIVNIDDTTLLICEMKSGKIVFNSSSIDLNYRKSQEKQLGNFIAKLNSSECLILKNTNGNSFEIDKNNFNNVIPILITQDNLGNLPLDERYDCLAYSIDDLRIFRDVLKTSIELIDFFNEHLLFNKKYKNCNFKGDVIDIFENHLFLQLHRNDYQEKALNILLTNNNIEITEYMFSLLSNKEINPPRMKIQSNIKFLIEALDKIKPKNYLKLGLTLLESVLEKSLSVEAKPFEKTLNYFVENGFSESGFVVKKNGAEIEIYKIYFFDTPFKNYHESYLIETQNALILSNKNYFKEKKKQFNFSEDNKISFYETIIYMRRNKHVSHILINKIDNNKLN